MANKKVIKKATAKKVIVKPKSKVMAKSKTPETKKESLVTKVKKVFKKKEDVVIPIVPETEVEIPEDVVFEEVTVEVVEEVKAEVTHEPTEAEKGDAARAAQLAQGN